MRGIAGFVMRGRSQAALATAASAVLSLLMPPAIVLSGACVALYTLRRGAAEGAIVTAIAAVGSAVLAWLAVRNPGLMVGLALVYWLPVWGLGIVLRLTVSMARTFHAAAAIGLGAILAFYAVIGDPVPWWNGILEGLEAALAQGGHGMDPALAAKLFDGLAQWAPYVPGQAAASIVATLVLALLLGRWWQAVLYNPGGFRHEFHQLRLGTWLAGITVLVFGASLVTGAALLANFALVLGILYLFQGVAIAHGLVAKLGGGVGWLVAFYVLGLIAFSQVVMLLGLIDAWIDFRSRVRPRTGSGGT